MAERAFGSAIYSDKCSRGKYVDAYLIGTGSTVGSKGNISQALEVCTDILPNKDVGSAQNIIVKYEYLASDGSLIESGQITLADVEHTCK